MSIINGRFSSTVSGTLVDVRCTFKNAFASVRPMNSSAIDSGWGPSDFVCPALQELIIRSDVIYRLQNSKVILYLGNFQAYNNNTLGTLHYGFSHLGNFYNTVLNTNLEMYDSELIAPQFIAPYTDLITRINPAPDFILRNTNMSVFQGMENLRSSPVTNDLERSILLPRRLTI